MKDRLIRLSYYLITSIIVIIITYVLINWLFPVVISCLIVLVLQPILARELKLLKIKNKYLRNILIIINYLFMLVIMILFILFCIISIYYLLERLPEYLSYLYNLFKVNHYIFDISKYLDIIYSSSISLIQSISRDFIDFIISFIMKLSRVLFDLVFIVITSLFMLLDYTYLERIIVRYSKIELIIKTIKEVLYNLFKTYLIIMLVTFIELWIGFIIIDLKDSMMIACVIALFDFLPVLGIDMIMIPWIIINALINNISFSIGLVVIYLIITITKNIIEPKLIAKRFKISPIISLIGMYLGLKLFGFIGIIIIPTVLLVIIEIRKNKKMN